TTSHRRSTRSGSPARSCKARASGSHEEKHRTTRQRVAGRMSKHYFGTDGVRGRVGKDPMSAEFALRLASAAARVLAPEGGTVLIGKDTRLSGYMFESALEAGFVAAGADVLLLGPLPTPGIAYLTQQFGA